MSEKFSYLLVRWVTLIAKNAKLSLALLTLLTVCSAIFSAQYFNVNSDLDRLIKPSGDRRWYSDNEIFKQQFPQYEKTALVVISGDNVGDVQKISRKLYQRLSNDERFYEVFAPQFSTFFDDRVLLSIPLEGLKRVSAHVADAIPDLQTLSAQPNSTQYIRYLQSRIDKDAELEFFSNETAKQLNRFSASVESLANNGAPVLPRLVLPFEAEDEGEKHIEMISLKSPFQFGDELPSKQIIANLRGVINEVKADIGPTVNLDNIEINLTGEIMLSHEEISAGLSGVELAGSISIVLLAIILGVGIRSWSVICAIFIMLGSGITITMALALVTVGSFNTLSLIFLVMFFGLGVDFAVHFSLRVAEAVADFKAQNNDTLNKLGAADFQACLGTATKDIGLLLVLCGLTSSIAFLAFLPTDYIGLGELGIISAGGMSVAVFLSLSFFPAWFMLFGLRTPTAKINHADAPSSEVPIRKVSPAIIAILIVSAGLGIAAVSVLDELNIDFSVLALRDENTEGMATLLELQERGKITDYSINILLNKSDYQNAGALKQQLLESDEVASIVEVADVIPKFQSLKMQEMTPVWQQLQGLNDVDFSVESSVDKAALLLQINKSLAAINIEQQEIFIDEDEQLLKRFVTSLLLLKNNMSLLEKMDAAIKAGLDKDIKQLKTWFSQTPYSVDELPDDVRARFISSDGQYLLSVLPSKELSDRADMQAFIEAVYSIAPNASGRSVVEWGVADVVVDAFKQAVAFSMLVIFLLLCIYFKSLLLPVLVMTPLVMTSIFTFALIVLSGLTLNMANILVVPLIFGLGIDTGIHVVHRYFSSRNLRDFYFSSTSKAVLISALTTIGTFLSLSLSIHKGAQSVGVLLAVAISLMLLVTFLLLPALLELLMRNKKHSAA